MTYTQIIKSSFAVLLLVCLYALTAFGQSQQAYTSTAKLLSEMDDVKLNRDQLAKLFRIGDQRIEVLLKALDDPNPDISLRAQIVIRYLGNETGMKGLFQWYQNQKQFRVSGPVPLPLNDWDYKSILANNYVEWSRAEPYIHALALDSSPKAKKTLDEMMRIAGELDEATVAYQAAKRVQESQPTKILSGKEDLAKLVLTNAFFVSPNDRKYASARLLALNGAKDKGLVEVYINRGLLSEEWYHVVVQKCEKGWRFFSVTPVAVS